ncbi:MAG: prenyltransferase [Archaeoglobus sp.]|nr:MAG: prenyltransferase [Archaeoglobus sp.]
MKLKSIWDLCRLEHGIMYAFGVISGIVVSSGHNFPFDKAVLGMLAAISLQASGFALNDYVDYKVDIANERFDRPIVRGEISRNFALSLSIALLPCGLILAYLISFDAFIFAFVVSALGYLYDLKLKEFGFAGNIYIAFSMAVPFLFGSVVAVDTISGPVVMLAVIAFLSGVGREVMKGIEDVEGDALRNVRTVARLFGINTAAKLSAVLFLIAIAMSFIPPIAYRKFMNPGYVIPVTITDIILVHSSLNLLKIKENIAKKTIRRLRKETLVALSFGLAGFVIGALF